MTGVILVVDDVPANIKLLEAKLTNEYFDVITAKDGYEALAQARARKPDLILLDVMMPGMDGFECCRQMKQDVDISHIPVVMVTALSEPSDRVQGLEAGADDFITKPINDTALFARVRSLVRIKVLIDELRLRDKSGSQMGMMAGQFGLSMDVSGASIMVVDDDAVQSKRLVEKLSTSYRVTLHADHIQALDAAKTLTDLDLLIISQSLNDIDGLRLATQFKAIEATRHVPIIMLVEEEQQSVMLKALELGVNDYLITPVDFNELTARVKTQVRRKKYQEALKSNYQESVSLAVTDGLTKLYNRHYLDTHLKNLLKQAVETGRPLAMLIMDMDHFKQVNDTYGHDVGDEVLRQLAALIVQTIRSADLAARYGGEEFVILMPETDAARAYEGAERIRKIVETTPFKVSHDVGAINKTISIGVSWLEQGDTPESLLKRADNALYQSKNSGRNKVTPIPDASYVPPPSRSISKPFASATTVAEQLAQPAEPVQQGPVVVRFASANPAPVNAPNLDDEKPGTF